MKTQTFSLETGREGYYNITSTVRRAIADSGVQSGVCVVFCPHTTGAITINENADPDVQHDLILGFDEAFPTRRAFRHIDGGLHWYGDCGEKRPPAASAGQRDENHDASPDFRQSGNR